MKSFILFILLFLISNSLYAQDIKIEKIELKNETFTSTISNFIDTRKQENQQFNSSGYILFSLKYYDERAKKDEVKYVFKIKDQYVLFNQFSYYPSAYTYVNGKLVLIYNPFNSGFSRYSKKSKRRLKKKVKRAMGKTERLVAYNSDGEKIIDDSAFNPNEAYNIHGGILLNIYGDGTVDIEK